VLNSLAVYYLESGNLARATKLHDEQAALNHRLGDRNAQANALSNLGYDYVCLGRPEAGRAALEQSLRLYQSTGARRETAYGRLNLGLAYWRGGDSRAARQVLEQVQTELAAMGDAFAQAAGLSYLALALEQSGDAADAGQNFAQARELFSAIGVHSFAADARAGQARSALALGRADEAREHVEAVRDYLQGHGAQGMELPVRAYLTCAEVFEALGDSNQSRAAVEEGYHELMQRADKIGDLEWRSSFIENVPEHRAIRDKWKQKQTGS
jgi:tetratricopeptide (TPR) repeat protein